MTNSTRSVKRSSSRCTAGGTYIASSILLPKYPIQFCASLILPGSIPRYPVPSNKIWWACLNTSKSTRFPSLAVFRQERDALTQLNASKALFGPSESCAPSTSNSNTSMFDDSMPSILELETASRVMYGHIDRSGCGSRFPVPSKIPSCICASATRPTTDS